MGAEGVGVGLPVQAIHVKQVCLGSVDPSFRALSGRLGFTFRRHKCNKILSPSAVCRVVIQCVRCKGSGGFGYVC